MLLMCHKLHCYISWFTPSESGFSHQPFLPSGMAECGVVHDINSAALEYIPTSHNTIYSDILSL